MDTSNLYVDHLAWCGLVALNMARHEGLVNSPAQEKLFLCRWLATAEKKRLFRRELANDIRWLLKEGREKGIWQVNWNISGEPAEEICCSRMTFSDCSMSSLTGIKYGVLSESEWEGRHAVKLSPAVPGLFIRKSDLETGFSEDGRQIKPLSIRITAEISAVDALLTRAGWI